MADLKLTLQELLTVIPEARLIHAEGPLLHSRENGPYSTIVYDSRKVVPGCIFLCIKGERSDGHDFAAQAAYPEGHDPAQPGEAVAVLKGGSHLCAPDYCMRYRPQARVGQSLGLGASHIGFRTVRRED